MIRRLQFSDFEMHVQDFLVSLGFEMHVEDFLVSLRIVQFYITSCMMSRRWQDVVNVLIWYILQVRSHEATTRWTVEAGTCTLGKVTRSDKGPMKFWLNLDENRQFPL